MVKETTRPPELISVGYPPATVVIRVAVLTEYAMDGGAAARAHRALISNKGVSIIWHTKEDPRPGQRHAMTDKDSGTDCRRHSAYQTLPASSFD